MKTRTWKWRIARLALVVGLLLMVPLVAMQFSSDVDWNLFDFIVAFVLLFGAGMTYELIARLGNTPAYRAGVGVAVVTGLMLVWVNLAVGIIGSENNPANLMYFGVLAIGFVGAGLARFKPAGMAWALFATAAAQMLVPVIAMILLPAIVSKEPPGLTRFFMLNGFFAALFTLAGLLFWNAVTPAHTTEPRSRDE